MARGRLTSRSHVNVFRGNDGKFLGIVGIRENVSVLKIWKEKEGALKFSNPGFMICRGTGQRLPASN